MWVERYVGTEKKENLMPPSNSMPTNSFADNHRCRYILHTIHSHLTTSTIETWSDS